MKIFRYALVGLLLASVFMISASGVAAQSSGVWVSAIQVQNLGTATATTQISFYNEDGSTAGAGISDTIDAGASKLFYLPAYDTSVIPDGFRGAAVVSADQSVAAIVNQVTSTSPYYNGSYSGVSVGSPTVYLPAIVRSYYTWDNIIAVQNTAMSPVDITINFYNAGGTLVGAATKTDTLAANGVGYYDISTSEYSALGSGFNGSAVVSADDGTTGLVSIVNQTTGNGMMQSYTGFSQGYETVYAPDLLVGWYNWFSALKVQNVGSSATDVLVTYSDGVTASQTLQPGAAYQFFQPSEPHASKWQGAATITTSGGDRQIVAIVSEATSATLAQAQTYEAFGVGGSKVSLPVIMKSHYGWNTAFTVQNLGPGTATIDITYEADQYGFAGTTFQDTIAEGQSQLYYQPAAPQLSGVSRYNGAVTLEVAGGGGQTIVAIVNQVCDGQLGSTVGDWSMSYSGMIP